MFAKFLTLSTLPVACMFAHDTGRLYSQGELKPVPTIMQIFAQQPEAIQHYDKAERKLYLEAEKIFHTGHGFVLHSEDSMVFLPNLSFNDRGYYILCGHRRDDYRFTCPNPDCGERWWFSDDWSVFCPVCGTPGE